MSRKKRIGNARKLERRSKANGMRCAGCGGMFRLDKVAEIGWVGPGGPVSHVLCRKCEAAWVEKQLRRIVDDAM